MSLQRFTAYFHFSHSPTVTPASTFVSLTGPPPALFLTHSVRSQSCLFPPQTLSHGVSLFKQAPIPREATSPNDWESTECPWSQGTRLPHTHAHTASRRSQSSPFLHSNMAELFTPGLTGSKICSQGILRQAVWNSTYMYRFYGYMRYGIRDVSMILEIKHTPEKALCLECLESQKRRAGVGF